MSKKERFLKLKLLHIIMNLQELLALPSKKKDLKKIKVKVSGFVVVKKIKIGEMSENVKPELRTGKIVAIVRNQITGLSNLLYGLAGDKSQVQTSQYPAGVVLYNSAGQVITNLTLQNVGTTPESTGATVVFQVYDNSGKSYTATQLQLISEADGTATPVATTTLTLTKQSDEVLYINWFLVFTVVSNPSNILIVPSVSPAINFSGCIDACNSISECGQSVFGCISSGTFPSCASGDVAQYLGQNFITSLLFSLIAYSTSSISYAYPGSNALGIAVNVGGYNSYTEPCSNTPSDVLSDEVILTIGETNFAVYQGYACSGNSSSVAYTANSSVVKINHVLVGIGATLQGISCAYMGVLIEFTT